MAFRAGAVTGLLVAGLALLGVAVYFTVLTSWLGYAPTSRTVVDALVALGFGASLISIFARLGGGIFTKGADVGGDLVGKVEAGIPEDDPRNPATIADNVGDNVGDCAGMAADLFETYAVTVVATMVLAVIYFAGQPVVLEPDALSAGRLRGRRRGLHHRHLLRAPRRQSVDHGRALQGLNRHRRALGHRPVAGDDYLLGGMDTEFTARGFTFSGLDLFWCGLVGLAVTALIIVVTEYYTGTNYRPVQSIARASQTGHGTNVIQGLAVSLEATALPALIIVAGIIVSYNIAGLFGIAIAVTAMLSLAGVVVGARRLRPGHRQRRRHRRDGGPAQGDPQDHGRARRRRQHHQGRHQGLCHRLGGLGRAGAVRGLQRGPQVLRRAGQGRLDLPGPQRRRAVLAQQPLRRRRPVLRRPAALPVRRHRHDGGRPRRRRDRGGGAPAVPREARHHAGHREAQLRARRRPADARGHQGDDRPLAAARALAHRVLLRGQAGSPAPATPSPRSAPCCSA